MPENFTADITSTTPREERIRRTLEVASIANTLPARQRVADRIGLKLGIDPAESLSALGVMAQEARDINLGRLNPIIEQIWQRTDLSPKTKKIFNQMSKMITSGGDPSKMLPIKTNEEIPDPGSLIPEIILLTILKDPELSPILMTEIDRIVKEDSDALLAEIDEEASQGRIKSIDFGIIGGGPLTSVALSAIGPITNNIVITEEDRIGERWRSRLLVYINSAVEGEGSGNDPLPILKGGTTPIVARYLAQAIRLGFLLDDKDLTILCEKGEIEEGRANRFIAGGKLGNAVGVNIFAYADKILVGQRVIGVPQYLPSGDKLIRLEDVKTKKQRQILVKESVSLTGPGSEYLPLADERSRRDYAIAKSDTAEYIANVKSQIERGGRIKLPKLPRILTLTATEDLMRLWTVDLKSNPDYYPFAPLFKPENRIGIIGGGDTGKVENEFCGLVSPDEAYPPNFKGNKKDRKKYIPLRDAYKFPSPEKGRVRYRNSVDKKTTLINLKVESFRDEVDRVVVQDEAGEERNYDYIFVGLGLKRDPVETKYRSSNISISKVRDFQGDVVALGNEAAGIYIAGSATGFTTFDFPLRIQRIIQINEIPENTVSLWINALLTEKLVYEIAATSGLAYDKAKRLYETGNYRPVAHRMVGDLLWRKSMQRANQDR